MVGNNIIISQESGSTWVPIAATKSDELQCDAEIIKISDASDGLWEHIISGRKSWSVTVSWLVTAETDIQKVLIVGSRVRLRIAGRSGSSALTGYAYVRTAKIDAAKDSLVKGSFVFQGDGALS